MNMDNNFKAFERNFPNQEARHTLAWQVARGEDIAVDYATYIQLGAHWGYEIPQLRNLARRLYQLGTAMHSFADQPVFILENGSLEDIFSSAPRLQDEVKASFGLIPLDVAKREVVHGFRGSTRTGRPYGRVKPPLVATCVDVKVVEAFSLDANSSDSTVEPTLEDSVLAYEAAIPLDEERGGTPEMVRDYKIIFGNTKFLEIARALQEKGVRPIEDKVGLSVDALGKIRDTRAISRNLATWHDK